MSDSLRDVSFGFINASIINNPCYIDIPLSVKSAIHQFANSPREILLFPIDHLQYPFDIVQKSILLNIKNMFHKVTLKFGSNCVDLYLKNNAYNINKQKLRTIVCNDESNWKYSKKRRKSVKMLVEMNTNGCNTDTFSGIACNCENTNGAINIYIYQDNKHNLPSRKVAKMKSSGRIKFNIRDFKRTLQSDCELRLISHGLGHRDVEIQDRKCNYCNC